MTLRERQVNDVTVIDVSGRITEEDGTVLLSNTVRRLAQAGRTRLVLNLLDTPYIDSAAMGEIVRGYTTAMRLGGALKLLHARGRVHDLLAVTRLTTVFEIFESESDALASFTGAST
ncbi:MAG: STAS domain-containing protein [Vicinamibacterales bacterium]